MWKLSEDSDVCSSSVILGMYAVLLYLILDSEAQRLVET